MKLEVKGTKLKQEVELEDGVIIGDLEGNVLEILPEVIVIRFDDGRIQGCNPEIVKLLEKKENGKEENGGKQTVTDNSKKS